MVEWKKFFAGCVVLLFWALLAAFGPEQGVWKEVRGDHFIVFHSGEDSFAQEVLRKAEQYYKQIGEDLGYERRSGFWQWEHRAKIYIYKTKEDFLEALLPHEITHLIFRDYVGFQGEVPIWLDEGVAQWEEPAKRKVVRSIMRFYLENGKGYSLEDLMSVDVRNMSARPAVEIFYVQAASIVDFLIAKYGSDSFIFFCRQLRDGKSIGAALPFAYPTQMRTVKEMEEKWKAYIQGGS